MSLSVMTFPMIPDKIQGLIDAETLCQIAVQNSLSCLDLMNFELQLYGRETLRNAMDAAGLSCGCIIAGVDCYTAAEQSETQIRAALEDAQFMRTDTLMIVPGQPSDEDICQHMTRQQMLEIAVEMYRLAVRLATPLGIRVVFENTPHRCKPLASADDCQAVLEQVPGLGLVFDTGNMKIADTQADALDFYAQLKPYIVRVHLKDVVVGPFGTGERCVDGQYIVPVVTGSGEIRMRELLEQIRLDGCPWPLVLEYSAPSSVHGSAHADALRPYVDYVNHALSGTLELAPQTGIPGLEKPISRLFFGTAVMPIFTGTELNHVFDAALAQGINAFDTARGYGYAEKSLGIWMQARNNRERVVILSKCGNCDAEGRVHIDRQVIESELAASLELLQTDYIDIYLLHRDDPQTPVSEIMETLNEAWRSGKIRVFGVSNWTHQRIQEANDYAIAHGLQGFAVSSPNYGLADQVCDPWGGGCVTVSGPRNTEARSWYTATQMPLVAYSSLGRGFFSGKFRSDNPEAARQILDPAAQKGYLYPENLERLRRAEQLAAEKQCSVPQIAMRYLFSGTMNVFAVVSTLNPRRMQENIHAALHPLSRQEADWLENI